ncbi:MAG TPA: pyridoxamine 5'-phosphate oxidase [Gaiellales bacterium]|nr:pyridoxamine 5'-phosphate oxidase [Gaiellales bacterium]
MTDPIALAGAWLEAAREAGVSQPEAMAIASADERGRPSVRMVLMRGLDAEGFRFYTNRESRKAAELDANPHGALVFHWDALGRQLRAEGPVRRLGDGESDAYFSGRPRESQLGAWASEQSRPLGSRQELLDRFAETERRFEGGPVERPPFWGGYLLVPEAIEFWEHGEHRLHHRRRFVRDGELWREELLAP